ncbi:MAG: diguanylate cyclase domain-containing protein [Thiobacillus sp.]
MKLGIRTRIMTLMALLGVLASGLTGYYAYLSSHHLLAEAAEREMLTSARVIGRSFSNSIREVAKDAALLAELPVTRIVADLPDSAAQAATARDRLAKVFESMLAIQHEYFQIRLIRADRHGLEVVRLDRDGAILTRVNDDELQEKGHFPYVFRTLKMKPGETYLSPGFINQEEGAHTGQGQPTVQVARQVFDSSGQLYGLVVINIDLNGLFHVLKADLPSALQLYLTNAEGDFLIHPDPDQTFGFQRGQRILAQDAFAPVADIVDGQAEYRVITVNDPSEQHGQPAEPTAAVFLRQPLGDYVSTDRYKIIGLSMPQQEITRPSRTLAKATLNIVLVFSVIAFALALWMSRAMTYPLQLILRAVERVSAGRDPGELPLSRNDELGDLARGVSHMHNQIHDQMVVLEEHRRNLDHLARHDTLTSLPNRRMFFDVLQQAIARAERAGTRLAVMFVDLDHFKEVNDTHGHAIGDHVLQTVAARLQHCVRTADTVARLGGDEFIILIDTLDMREPVTIIAQKLIAQFDTPINAGVCEIKLGVSIGISLLPEDGNDAETLVARADEAMYAAKLGGRNGFSFYASAPPSPSSDPNARRQGS